MWSLFGLSPALAEKPEAADHSSDTKHIKPSARLYNPDKHLSALKLDLSRAPSKDEISASGMDCGGMFPTSEADPNKLLEKLNTLTVIKEGKRTKLTEQEKLARMDRLQKTNLDFAKAIERWNAREYRKAIPLLEKHIKEFPDSPWLQEARMHVADNAQWTGLFTDAILAYQQVIDETDPAFGSVSFDVHWKAVQKWAGVDILLGRFADAETKVDRMQAGDRHWRRLTWASYWKHTLQMFKSNSRELHTCGSNALLVVLDKLGKGQQAAQLATLTAPRKEGYNLAELAQMSRKYGVEMRGFRASVEQLAKLPMPLLIHCDFHGSQGSKALICAPEKQPSSTKAHQHDIKTVSLRTSAKTKANTHSKVAASSALLSCCASPAQGIQKSHGHYFVVKSVDARNKLVRLYNPQVEVEYTVRYSDLQKEYSGTGLLPLYETTASDVLQRLLEKAPRQNKNGVVLAQNKSEGTQQFAWLSSSEMKNIMGGCYVVGKTSGLGKPRKKGRIFKNPCGQSSRGEPSIWVNQVSLNMFIEDTPMWHDSTIGPDVNITMSYNSLDSNNYVTPFGNKWSFNYSSHTAENTAGDVTLFMPDGSQDLYRKDPQYGMRYGPQPPNNIPYTSPIGNYNKLVGHGTWSYQQYDGSWLRMTTGYTLTLPDGTKYIYGTPNGYWNGIRLIKETDPWGHSLTFGYDSSNKLTSITDAAGKKWTLSYSGNYITQVKDPWERVASFSYDADGNMIEAVDMEGHAFQYTYDEKVQITQLNTAQGPWTFVHRDYPATSSDPEYGQKYIRVLDPKQDQWQKIGHSGKTSNGAHEDRYYYTDARGNTTNYGVTTIIEGQGYITSVTYPNGTSESTTWSTTNARISARTDVRGRQWAYTYNSQGNPTQIQVTANNPTAQTRTTTISYATNGWDVLSTTNALTQTPYTYTYDAYHQVTSVKDALNSTASDVFTYTAWGAIATATDRAGHVTTYNYDTTTKQLTSVSRDGVLLTSFTYDEIGRVKAIKDETSGQIVTREYNNLDQVTKVAYSDGTYQQVEYVCCGMPGLVRDRSGRVTYYDFDVSRQLVRVQDAQGNSIQLEYDPAGNMTKLIDAKGNETRWVYDNMDRVSQKVYDDGTYDQFNYTGALLTSVRNVRGLTTNYSHNAWDEITLVDHPTATGSGATPDVSASYDALSRPVTVTDGLGTRSFSYDVLGRVTGEDGPWANDSLTYHYDGLGRHDWMQVQNSDATQFQTSYGFDALNRVNALTSPVGAWSYGYMGNTGKLQTLTQPNGSATTYTYDSLDRLSGLANRKSAALGSALISGYNYGYDNAQHKDARSWMESQVDTNPLQRVNYGYDELDQLVSEVSTEATPLLNKTYQYDAMSNRTGHNNSGALGGFNTNPVSVDYTSNKLNQLLTHTSTQGGNSTTYSYGFDAGGNLSSIQKVGDAQPNTSYSYDDLHRLTEVVTRDSNGNPAHKTEYVYDYASRKAVSREYSWNGTTWTLDSEKRRLYNGMDIVQERDGNNVTTANLTRHGNIGGILARTSYTGGTSTSVFYHYDGSGNVVQLTDSNQTCVAEYSYDAYGNTLSATGAQAGNNPYRYSTKEITYGGLYDYGWRFYSPSLGRWINRDPIAEAGGLNLYCFVGNNPVNYIDFYGLAYGSFCPNWRGRHPGRVPNLRKWFWTGDAYAPGEVYNEAVNGAGDWWYESYPVRGGYVSWSPPSDMYPYKVKPKVKAGWTVDSGFGASVSVSTSGRAKGDLPEIDAWKGGGGGSYGWSEDGGWKWGLSGSLTATPGTRIEPRYGINWSDPFNGGKVTQEFGAEDTKKGFGGGIVTRPPWAIGIK